MWKVLCWWGDCGREISVKCLKKQINLVNVSLNFQPRHIYQYIFSANYSFFTFNWNLVFLTPHLDFYSERNLTEIFWLEKFISTSTISFNLARNSPGTSGRNPTFYTTNDVIKITFISDTTWGIQMNQATIIMCIEVI